MNGRDLQYNVVSFTAKIWFDMTLYHDIHIHYYI